MLAKEVLAEIPDQVTAYMKKYNLKPNPPMAAKAKQPVPRPTGGSKAGPGGAMAPPSPRGQAPRMH